MKRSLRFSELKVYIASPFFNPEQLNLVMDIEMTLGKIGIPFFSPRLHGRTIKDLPVEERKEAAEEAFDLNLKGIWDSTVLLHVLDGKDLGSAWESGFWVGTFGRKNSLRPVVMFMTGDKPLNIMLQQITSAIVRSNKDLELFIERVQDAGFRDACEKYSNFGTNLT